MRVLGIDASGPAVAVGLAEGELVLAECMWTRPRTASNHLVEWVKAVVAEFGWPEGIGVGLGPGSFTGTRIAVTVAKMLAWARGIPVVGVSSLAAWAAAAPPGTVVAVTSERRGAAFYAGLYRVADPEPVALMAEAAVDGALPDPFPWPEPLWLVGPLAADREWHPRFGRRVEPRALPLYGSWVARLAGRRLVAGEAVPPDRLMPSYLRPPAVSRRAARGREEE
ncbi:MAG: tRNA (adenosine(37)-N6)-threonylcarbamoyltransferase complex dimerization subunit type 1 TsaB [Firmicutes bacterium]|nr:tRNA (adenosine(37)-N6)-threonylcarbamoyltransferase complex dimerization subunit type 1 TsaB [Alicyclobacillaceae bacterium]MCL6497455.1 tRNA (adenosine(37)-N6)-threonylcarbamoyltransferase complex dimerization subunit type 1 TsaB [Bacillota bacterium]